jgi:DNA-binding beta-propeller fold protein YncE
VLAGCDPGAPIHTPLTPRANIQLPKDSTTPVIDLLALDPRVSRLYVSHTSNSALDVIDLQHQKVIGTVRGLIGIKAIALTADPKVVYTSDADGSVNAIDVPGLKVTKTIDVGGTPDAADYDPVHNLVAVSLSKDKVVALIDPVGQKVVARIPLPGDPELFAVDQHAGHIFLAIHSLDEVVEIDPSTQSISTTYKGCDIKAPTGLALDVDQGRLFISNAGATLSIVDVVVDRCLGSVDIGHGTDQIAFNSHAHHVYTADGGSRYVSVIDSVSLKPLGFTGTGPGASTIATDPTTDLVYVAVKRAGIIAVYHDP